MKTINIKSTADLPKVASALLDFAQGEKFFVFEGEMAAGKTTFIKSLCQVLGVNEVVSSPTFSIVNEYHSPKDIIYHFDFYRLKNIHEAYDIGYEEYFYSKHYCLVEWPQKVTQLLPEQYIKVELSIVNDQERDFVFRKVN
jgi:tRNA threonylcarbamoyladenosine biosynthesis protein TsaE